MKYAKVKILMASVALLGLAACNKAGQPSGQTASGSASGEDAAEKKLNSYVIC